MQTFVLVVVALISVVPAMWRLWQRRATLGKRHLAVFGAMAGVGGILIAVFGPMLREGGWGALVALVITLAGGGLAAIGGIGLLVTALLMAVPASRPSALAEVSRRTPAAAPRQPPARTEAAHSVMPAQTEAAGDWTAPSRARREDRAPPPAARDGGSVASGLAQPLGIAALCIACALMWLYAGAALWHGRFVVPIGRRSRPELTGMPAILAAITLALLTFALFTHLLQRVDPERSARYTAWRRGSLWAAIGVLALGIVALLLRRFVT
jgi:hypothetical protein